MAELIVPKVVTLPLESKLTDFSEGYVTKTAFEPAEKLTSEPELLDANTVSRDKVVPEAVYVPTPTSHSELPCPAIQ